MVTRTVVVVDEEPRAQAFIAYMLEKDGFEPSTFGSTSAARSSLLAARERPCLAVVDVGPHGTQGLEFARWLLAENPLTGIVFTTTGTMPDLSVKGLPTSRVQVLQKPFLAEEFRRRVDSLLLRAPERAHAQASGESRDDIGA